MTTRKYIDYYNFDSAKVRDLLKSENVNDRLDALLTTVLGSGDYQTSDELIFQFTKSDDVNIRQNAILCIGHLVRMHEKIDLEKYIPILESILLAQDEFLVDNAEDALNDIWIFFDKGKIKRIIKHDCVGRYFSVLELSDSHEKNKTYDEGIRTLEELIRSESNPSVLRVQNTSLEYLKSLRDTSTGR